MNILKRNALTYERYSDQSSKLKPETLIELRQYLQNQFDEIASITHFSLSEIEGKEMVDSFLIRGDLYISLLHNNSIIFTAIENLKFRAAHDWVHIVYYKLYFGKFAEKQKVILLDEI